MSHAVSNILLFSAPLVVPVIGPVICDGTVAVAEGRVCHVGTRAWVIDRLKEEVGFQLSDCEELRWHGLITPGLVNAHTHLQYTGMTEVGLQSYGSFRAWIDAFNAVYDDPEPKPWGVWARKGAQQLIAAGTTAAADVVADAEAIDTLRSCGLHGISYWEVMDWNNSAWVHAGSSIVSHQLDDIRVHSLGTIGISPHAPYSLGSRPLLDLSDIARTTGMRLHIHLAETADEAGLSSSASTDSMAQQSEHIGWGSFNELKATGAGTSAIQFVDQLAVLGPDVHIAHGVYASREDRKILRERGVSVALCPRSNRITCTGAEAPIAHYLKEGNMLAVGTDSLASAPSLDVLDDISCLYDMARAQGYVEKDLALRLIRMATLGGAEAMGLATGLQRIGQISVGAYADLAFFDTEVDVCSPEAQRRTLEHFVRFGAGSCRATVIEGRIVSDHAWV